VYLCRTGSPRGFTGPLEGGSIDPGVDGDVIAVVEVARDSSARSPRRSLVYQDLRRVLEDYVDVHSRST